MNSSDGISPLHPGSGRQASSGESLPCRLTGDSLFTRRFLALKLAASFYVVALCLSHAVAGSAHVWVIAAFFSIAMNATYPWAAWVTGRAQPTELAISALLVALSVLGVFVAPPFVIAAIFLHGAWDLAKHRGAGVPFFGWYTLGCVSVDWLYALALIWFYTIGGAHG